MMDEIRAHNLHKAIGQHLSALERISREILINACYGITESSAALKAVDQFNKRQQGIDHCSCEMHTQWDSPKGSEYPNFKR